MITWIIKRSAQGLISVLIIPLEYFTLEYEYGIRTIKASDYPHLRHRCVPRRALAFYDMLNITRICLLPYCPYYLGITFSNPFIFDIAILLP